MKKYNRINKQQVKEEFKNFIRSIDGDIGEETTDKTGYYLEYKIKTGYRIRQITYRGAVTCPFGGRYLKKGEIMNLFNFGRQLLYISGECQVKIANSCLKTLIFYGDHDNWHGMKHWYERDKDRDNNGDINLSKIETDKGKRARKGLELIHNFLHVELNDTEK